MKTKYSNVSNQVGFHTTISPQGDGNIVDLQGQLLDAQAETRVSYDHFPARGWKHVNNMVFLQLVFTFHTTISPQGDGNHTQVLRKVQESQLFHTTISPQGDGNARAACIQRLEAR